MYDDVLDHQQGKCLLKLDIISDCIMLLYIIYKGIVPNTA